MSFLDYLDKKEKEKPIVRNQNKPKPIEVVEQKEEITDVNDKNLPHPFNQPLDYAAFVLEGMGDSDEYVEKKRKMNTQANSDLDHAELLL